jgi:hypothetical protein
MPFGLRLDEREASNVFGFRSERLGSQHPLKDLTTRRWDARNQHFCLKWSTGKSQVDGLLDCRLTSLLTRMKNQVVVLFSP